ncbi:5'/3'-nucleotidase SurE [Psychrobacter jeotgali]|uniref:5'/3'-nucleotidase SurE n=1 Tax=Psychrobacter jeotgali TaxID=179010 RepID=UPI00191A5C86|nr:5'/3'-nucleotidase SurE [Psychrobacter jeotgali]
MKFLISNDDGIHAPGLLALYEALSEVGEVKVVAPNTEQSGTASALHITQPLYTHTLPSGFVAVNGTPADCVYLALHELYPDTAFDCIITGINSGENLGQNVLFSGTFGAASIAHLFGIPAIATSLVGGAMHTHGQARIDLYQMAAAEVVKLMTQTSVLQELQDLPYHVLNVNIPNVNKAKDIKGRRVTTLAYSKIAQPVHKIVDPRGRDAYWLSLRKRQHSQTMQGATDKVDASEQQQSISASEAITSIMTDSQAVAAGFISLSPVKLYHTPTATIDRLAALND